LQICRHCTYVRIAREQYLAAALGLNFQESCRIKGTESIAVEPYYTHG
jgi:hypothetical protein